MKLLTKRLMCAALAAVMALASAPVSESSAESSATSVYIAGIAPSSGDIVVTARGGVEKMYCVMMPVGTQRPAAGQIPDDAVEMQPCEAPFYDRGAGYYSGLFDISEKSDGSYVLYATVNGGGSWYPYYDEAVCSLFIGGGRIQYMNFGAWGKGDDMENPDWNELIGPITAELKDGIIRADVFSGWLIYNPDMTMTIAEEFSEKSTPTSISYGDPKTNTSYGNSFSAEFELPKEEGFYKIYFNLFGLDFQADKAFWVAEDGTATVVELGGIAGSVLDAEDYIVRPADFYNPEDKNYIYPPFINLLDPIKSYFIWEGSDTILAYSFDGGGTWNQPPKNAASVSVKTLSTEANKYLKKNSYFELAVKIERPEKDGELPEDKRVLRFPRVYAQPDAPKLAVNYQALYLDPAGNASLTSLAGIESFWALTKPNTDDIICKDIQIAPLTASIPHVWYDMPQTGVAVKPLYITTTAKNGKVSYRAKKQSALYAIRVGATENDDGSYTLPSDWVKLKAGGLEAPKAVKPDYKNERVKPPRGTMYSLRDSRGVGDGRKTVDLDEGQWTYRSMPTRKKAPGATVSHQVAPRAEFDPGTTALQNGKLNADKKLEFLYNGSWSGFKAPQGPQTSEILVRVKPSGKPKSTMSYTSAQAGSATMRDSPHASGTAEMAKAGQWVPEQTVLLASLEYSFTYEWGEFANDRGKTVSGILSYKFTKLED